MEEEVREECQMKRKSRLVRNDKYEKKGYLGKLNVQDTKKILKVRLNMCKIPGNYKGKSEGICPLCHDGEGNIEHYFQCTGVYVLAETWGVQRSDLESQEEEKMIRVAKFIEKVECMLEPVMTKIWLFSKKSRKITIKKIYIL